MSSTTTRSGAPAADRLDGPIRIGLIVAASAAATGAGLLALDAVAVAFAGIAGALAARLARPVVERWCATVGIAVDTRHVLPIAANAALWCAAIAKAGDRPAVIAWLAVSALAVWAAWIDAHTHRIPLALSRVGAILAAFLLAAASATTGDLAALARAVVAAGGIFAATWTFAVVSRGMLGLGDVWFLVPLMLIAGYEGWDRAGVALVLGLGLMVPAVIARSIRRGGAAAEALPAAPYLVAGTAAALADSTSVTRFVGGVAVVAIGLGLPLTAPRRLARYLGPGDRLLITMVFGVLPMSLVAMVIALAVDSPLPVVRLVVILAVVALALGPVALWRLSRASAAAQADPVVGQLRQHQPGGGHQEDV
ncbi:prepilin peptidase [Nocardia terpenica]|uniref:prepilin peptidase n=1 Tax=Nocardia terpenica TaxID=455432 RepID=UPI0012FD12F1